MSTDLAPFAAPLTLEGSPVLHQMFAIDWKAWRQVGSDNQRDIVHEATAALGEMKQTALFAMLGHKGDLQIVHFRETFDQLHQAELTVARLGLSQFLQSTTSYVSVVELGLYDSTIRLQGALAQRELAPGSPEWAAEISGTLEQQRKSMHPRLWPEIPRRRYHCFYPMDKKRADGNNWYSLPMAQRGKLMREHGVIGRKYAGEVTQIISGSIGFDNWEWGVDLFADDPVVFKRLIYEMRFDEASALYAVFGPFYISLRFEAFDLQKLMQGKTPGFAAAGASE
jgi:hydrogen peroxide-dependent heme synthase